MQKFEAARSMHVSPLRHPPQLTTPYPRTRRVNVTPACLIVLVEPNSDGYKHKNGYERRHRQASPSAAQPTRARPMQIVTPSKDPLLPFSSDQSVQNSSSTARDNSHGERFAWPLA